MPSEEAISVWETILSDLVSESGKAEKTRIVPNLEVIDASPSAPLTNYIIVKGGPGGAFNGPALKLPGYTYTNGDLVNVLFVEGTEPIAMQQGSGSAGTNGGKVYQLYDSTLTNVAAEADASGDVTFNFDAQIDGNLLIDEDIIHTGDADTNITATTDRWDIRAGNVAGLSVTPTEVVVNDGSADQDFRAESDSNTHAFFLNAGTDGVIIGGATQQTTGSKLELHKSDEVYLTLYNSGDNSGERGTYIRFHHSGGLGAGIGAYRDASDNDGMNMIFLTEPVGGTITARGYIDSDGRWSIASGLPTNGRLEVFGTSSSSYPVPQVRVGTAATPYAGLYATGASGAGIVNGAEEDGTNWTARATGASINRIGTDGTFRIFGNTGLTAGNTFTPAEIARFSPGGFFGLGVVPAAINAAFQMYGANIAGLNIIDLVTVNNTAQTVVANATRDASIAAYFLFRGQDSTGTFFANTSTIMQVNNGADVTFHTNGSDNFNARVNANGSADIRRSSGSTVTISWMMGIVFFR